MTAALRRLGSSWLFWSLALLALPNCSLDRRPIGSPPLPAPPPPPHLSEGALPHTSAIMCDIEKYQGPSRRCATAEDLAIGIPLTEAAEALVAGRAGNVGLDFSAAAQAVCGDGIPQAIDFQGAFPDGFAVCLNCGDAIPYLHADSTAVCVAKCQDLVDNGSAPFPPDSLAFCTANAHLSTHFPTSGCFENACSDGGTLRSDFADPRRIPEPVVWTDLIGTAAVGSTLTRTAAATGGGTADFNAGAVSTQWIHSGDGYVEFEAAENNMSHLAGLAEVPAACAFPCTDTDPGVAGIGFSITLRLDGRVYVFEDGALVPGPDVGGSFGTYAAGERFRVRVKDAHDGTGTVTYTRLIGACIPGNPCNETVFFTHVGARAAYPLRVDTSFLEQNATLANVSIVRIQ